MFYIKIKGRKGFYNGVKHKHRVKPTEHREYPNTDPKHELGVLVKENKVYESDAIVLKLEQSEVRAVCQFTTAKEAQKEIDRLKTIAEVAKVDNVNEYFYPAYTNTWRNTTTVAHVVKTITNLNADKVEKWIDKLEVFEDVDVIIPKKTYALINLQRINYRKGVKQVRPVVCDTCRVTLVPDEPYVHVNRTYMCNNCVQRMAVELQGQYEKQDLADQITDAWTLEMMMR